jgi:hypothetical protein
LGDTQTHRQQGELISLLLFFQNKESRLKKCWRHEICHCHWEILGWHSNELSGVNMLCECKSQMSKQSLVLVYRVYSVSTLMWICEVQYNIYRGLFTTDYLCTLFIQWCWMSASKYHSITFRTGKEYGR